MLQCAVDTLCTRSIPPKLQSALTLLTDYCSIISECSVGVLLHWGFHRMLQRSVWSARRSCSDQ